MSASGPGCVKNAKTLGGDGRNHSSKIVLAVKLASVLNIESQLKNVILAGFDLSRFHTARSLAEVSPPKRRVRPNLEIRRQTTWVARPFCANNPNDSVMGWYP
jgi:hypothetical protein